MKVLKPAYSRDYKSAQEVSKAYHSGLDFVLCSINGNTYCSCRDFPDENVELRFNKGMHLTIVGPVDS